MAFKGQRVMLSRNLVPPEKYDMILDKLKQNEAEVILCSNPGYNSSNDFHFLFSFNNVRVDPVRKPVCLWTTFAVSVLDVAGSLLLQNSKIFFLYVHVSCCFVFQSTRATSFARTSDEAYF